MKLFKKKQSKKETLLMYLKGLIPAIEKMPSKAINKENSRVIAKSITDIINKY